MSELTLKHFILKQRVLNLYREAIRASRCKHLLLIRREYMRIIQPSAISDQKTRRETILWIRCEFDRNRNIHDLGLIEDKIAIGRRELRQILPTMSLPLSHRSTF
ncbi:hypothetical protein A0H81_00700 [Grifola frondosa]|uniref:Complex 1 LYR protein domain-containing protein n=1 Tax=Grifola frondosa TaxID=5627 RepID=A0A1C7MU95_GRIFR|nr:hypothetical protein A0H81_00700 [Grifola frondosa]